jgi:ribosome-associated protein
MKSKSAKSPALPPVLKSICVALDDKKAGDIRVLRVSEQSSITDYLVIATGTSEPHLRALRVELEKVIDASGTRIVGMDTGIHSGWLVIDAFDIMVHIFTPENREKYSLENLWKDAEEIGVNAVVSEPKVAKKAATRKSAKAAKKAAPMKKKASG